jgi:hypothetical protein
VSRSDYTRFKINGFMTSQATVLKPDTQS